MLAAVAKIFGDRGGVVGALQAGQRRCVGRCGHHHRAAQAFFAEDVLDEFLDFAAAFADQADHDHIGFGEAGHHAEQHRFADAGAGEQTDPLAAADRQHRVDGAHTGIERAAHRVTVHRIDRPADQGRVVGAAQRPFAVDRIAMRIDDAPEQTVTDRQVLGAVLVAPPRVLLAAQPQRNHRRRARDHDGAAGQAVNIAGRHQIGMVAGETDHFGLHRRLARHAHFTNRAHRHPDAGRLEHQAGHANQQATRFKRLRLRRQSLEPGQIVRPLVADRAGGNGMIFKRRTHHDDRPARRSAAAGWLSGSAVAVSGSSGSQG